MSQERLKLLIKGVVQGVGFRPFIYQLAQAHNLKGWVLNSSGGVIIEAEGEKAGVEAFLLDIKPKAPPRAVIESIENESLPVLGYKDFVIKKSVEEEGKFQLVSPDISICEDCLRELFDPKDRRYRYPFINCTNCGPRFTIIEDIPYDRPKTTMKKFKMCSDCQREYNDPMNRRFHAQPNACPICGPSLQFIEGQVGADVSVRPLRGPTQRSAPTDPVGANSFAQQNEAAIKQAVEALRAGNVVAIKGLGGFHLACDAENDEAVKKLRVRKRRYGKPLAIMVLDLKQVEKFCYVSDKEKEILTSPQRPIVLLRRKPDTAISKEVAPNNNYLGVMLPYTPLHYLILKDSGLALIMTSGNLSEEPIAAENEEALRRLGHIADSFLLHNRDIYSRYDDPVVRVIDGELTMIRRARSFAPYPIHVPFKVKEQILAVGGELKSTFCLAKDTYAFVSQHIGDMENLETLEHFENTLELYKKLFRVDPKVVAYDLHPEYFSTKYALELENVKLVGCQHHHAHIVSCAVENNVSDPVIGVSFDGTGYGTDGTIWGGEFLISTWKDFERVGYLRQVRLPGGEVAIEKPYRTAFSYLYTFFGEDYSNLKVDYLKHLDPVEVEIMKKQIKTGLLSPLTSSSGRLFDAVSSLVGIRHEIEFEGQAAIEMEMLADEDTTDTYGFHVGADARPAKGGVSVRPLEGPTQRSAPTDPEGANLFAQPLVVDTEPIIRGVVEDLQRQVPVSKIAAKFHNTVVEFVTDMCNRLREKTGINIVALSGGVFQNAYLLTRLKKRLHNERFEVLTQRQVPANDGGISLGQAVIAHENST